MFRSALATAAAILATSAFASTAQACISCEYVPEVVREHSTLNAKPRRVQVYAAAPRHRVRPAMPVVKMPSRRIETASITKPNAVEKAETVDVAAPIKTQSSSVALLKTETTPVKQEAAVTDKPAAAAIETASVAPAATPEAKADAPAAKGPVGCKRFIPAVGVTLSVACD